jgi:antitoxin (DNA-binding transcriptional repressor) of toxin-antitoxin stability system
MTTVNVHEAKTRLLQLIAEAETGGEVVIARNGKPVARPVRHADASAVRRFGALRGRIETGEAFFDPLPEAERAAWE